MTILRQRCGVRSKIVLVHRAWTKYENRAGRASVLSFIEMKLFGKQDPQQVTNGQFEIEQDGSVATLEYALSGKVLELIHTEVPESMRGRGVAAELAESALQWARQHGVKVDVICPVVAGYVQKHPEYSDLLLR